MDTTKQDPLVGDEPIEVHRTGSTPPTDYDVEAAGLRTAIAGYVPGSKAEKLLVRKIDLFMIPTLWFMCVLAYVDRNNIGNAKAAGMSKDLGLNDSSMWFVLHSFMIVRIRFQLYNKQSFRLFDVDFDFLHRLSGI